MVTDKVYNNEISELVSDIKKNDSYLISFDPIVNVTNASFVTVGLSPSW